MKKTDPAPSLFEVVRNGNVIMATNYLSCVYGYETLVSMKSAGLTFRVRGLPWRLTRENWKSLKEGKDE